MLIFNFNFKQLLFQIAAISPADINYDESLSTLRYGQYIIFNA